MKNFVMLALLLLCPSAFAKKKVFADFTLQARIIGQGTENHAGGAAFTIEIAHFPASSQGKIYEVFGVGHNLCLDCSYAATFDGMHMLLWGRDNKIVKLRITSVRLE